MQFPTQYPMAERLWRRDGLLRMLSTVLIAACAMLAASTTAYAQFQGTKTVGGAGADYATIDLAVADLATRTVTGPIVFSIANGSYTPPSGGWTLPNNSGMSATNTVTFKPAAGATVTIVGTTNDGTAIFTIDGGKHYVIDGSNSSGGTSRDMTIRQTSTTYSAAVWMRNDADYNVLENCIVQSTNGTGGVNVALGGVTIFVGQSTAASGNDSNLVQNNLVGDPNGVYRGYRAIYVYGASTSVMNVGTKVIDNDVVNFGNAQSNCFGIFISYNNYGAIIRGNTVRMTTASGTSFYQIYAVYCNQQYVAPNGNTANTTIERNKIYGLQTTQPTGYEYIYGISLFVDNNTNSSTDRIFNNVIVNDRGSAATYFYGFQITASNTNSVEYIANNSMYLAGSGTNCYMAYISPGTSTTFYHYNNIYYSTWSSGGYGVYLASSTSLWYSNNNLVEFNTTNSGAYTAYYGGTQKSLTDFKNASAPQESASVGGNPHYVDVSTANLHIDTVAVSQVESRGRPVTGVTTDIDLQARNTVTPDIGADEGNFNGAGITVTYPNAPMLVLAENPLTVTFDLSRALVVNIDLTVNNGASWTRLATNFSGVAGGNSYTFTTPDVATSQARIRVLSTVNQYEGDTSNAPFSLVRPTIHVVAPNGGEVFTEGLTTTITWTSTDIPSDKRVAVDYSSDYGATWNLIATNLPSTNLPGSNSVDWMLPAIRTNGGLVRVRMLDKDIADISDAPFTVLKSINLVYPDGGQTLFVGDQVYVKWLAPTLARLTLDYSTDNGATWIRILDRIPRSIDSIAWLIPNTPTTTGLVRISDASRPAIFDVSGPISIVLPRVTVLTPNGGERFELGQRIPVTWASSNVTSLRLDISTDNGTTWQTGVPSIPAATGRYDFVPTTGSARFVLIRLVDVDRPWVNDQSDRSFEIMAAPSISIYSPTPGDVLYAGSQTVITWLANRINAVNIDYSPSPSSPQSWVRIVSNLPARTGFLTWTVPSTLTTNGMLRISEVGGSIVAEASPLTVVAPPTPVARIRLIEPVGGETYTHGDTVRITWTSMNMAGNVSIGATVDGWASRATLTTTTPVSAGVFLWVPPAPSTSYQIRIDGAGGAFDTSKVFTVKRRIIPRITVLYPNGNETFATDSNIVVSWQATDVTGNVNVEYSLDGGSVWNPIGVAGAMTANLAWKIPSNVSTNALVRVYQGAVGDTSDAPFSIILPTEVQLLTPNLSSVVWREGDTVAVTWSAQNVPNVDLDLSIDGGTTYTVTIGSNLPASTGTFSWKVPHLSDNPLRTLIARVSAAGTGTPFDLSDESFSFQPRVGAVENGVTGASLGLVSIRPNPASSLAVFEWRQPAPAQVLLVLVDQSGRVISTRQLGHFDAGRNTAEIDVRDLASGTYQYEILIGGRSITGRFAVVR